jgi:hypothetical protein
MIAGQTLVRVLRPPVVAVVVFSTVRAAVLPIVQSHDFPTWVEAVETHVPGARDQAVERPTVWSGAELGEVVAAFWRSVRNDQIELLQRALVLHADIAILNRDERGYDLPAGQGTTILVEDGREIGQMSRTAHWEVTRRLLAGLPPGTERTRIGRQFYRATAAVLQQWGELPELTTHLEAGRRLLGDDPVLLLYEGTTHRWRDRDTSASSTSVHALRSRGEGCVSAVTLVCPPVLRAR